MLSWDQHYYCHLTIQSESTWTSTTIESHNMNQINLKFTLVIIIIVSIFLNATKSEELLELKCFNETECKQYQHSGIVATCTDEHCQCSSPTGDHVNCKPLDRKVNNIIGGPCPCYQPNSECDEDQDICYCASDYMPSSDKRRCIKKVAQMGEECEQDFQCQQGDYNGLCDPFTGKCYCMTLFVNDNGTCASIVGVRMFCTNDSICTDKFGNNSKCFVDTYHCVCVEGYISSVDNSSCLKVPKYLENCTENLQCIESMGPGGKCVEDICQCDTKYFVEERKSEDDSLEAICSPIIEPGQYCRYPGDCYQRQLNESEQTMACIYGECNCRSGFYSLNEGDCIRGDAGIKIKPGYFVMLVIAFVTSY